MSFLVSTDVQNFLSVLGDDCSRLHFCRHDVELEYHLSDHAAIDVWICHGKEVTKELLDLWLSRHQESPKSLLVKQESFIPHLKGLSSGRLFEIGVVSMQEQCDLSRAVSILRAAERLYARGCAQRALQDSNIALDDGHPKSVLVVGAGIMGLMAAESLAVRGFQVRIVDANPDPRTCDDWTRLGATHGGGDARMFTFTEADSYNEKGSDIYHDMRHIFRKTTIEGGWSVKSSAELSTPENNWIDAFERVPTWLAQAMKEDIYYVNQEAGSLWTDFMARAPNLFSGVSLHPNILRLYAEDAAFIAAQKLNEELGTIIDEPSLPELLRENKGLYMAAELDDLAGGFVVRGFTLAIHLFVHKLINHMIKLGVKFTWNCSVERIQRDGTGRATLLESQGGSLQADNYVISTGVTRNGLLDGTASENLVQGVLGVWLQIPNVDPMLKKSAKIHRRGYCVEDINVTVSTDVKTGEEILILGGGYGYVGLGVPRADSTELHALFAELEEVARIYFPMGYRIAKEHGTLWPKGHRKYCIRPFTSTGLGVLENVPTASGGRLLITGGNNTGGFAQAPAIARAIHRAIEGRHDPIHELFHPCRSKLARH